MASYVPPWTRTDAPPNTLTPLRPRTKKCDKATDASPLTIGNEIGKEEGGENLEGDRHDDDVYRTFRADPATLLALGASTYLVEFATHFDGSFVTTALEKGRSVVSLPDIASLTSQHVAAGLISTLNEEIHTKLTSAFGTGSFTLTLKEELAETFVASLPEADKSHVLDAIWEIATRAGKVTFNYVTGKPSSKLQATSEVAMAAIAARMGVGVPLLSGRLSTNDNADSTRSELITLWTNPDQSHLSTVYINAELGKQVAMISGMRHVVRVLGGLGITHLNAWNSALIDLNDPMRRVYIGKFDASDAFPEDESTLSAMFTLLAILCDMNDEGDDQAYSAATSPLWFDLYEMAERVARYPGKESLVRDLKNAWQKRTNIQMRESPMPPPFRDESPPVPLPPKANPENPPPPPPQSPLVPPPPKANPANPPPPPPPPPNLRPAVMTVKKWNGEKWVNDTVTRGGNRGWPLRDLTFLKLGNKALQARPKENDNGGKRPKMTPSMLMQGQIKMLSSSKLQVQIDERNALVAIHEHKIEQKKEEMRTTEQERDKKGESLREEYNKNEAGYLIRAAEEKFPKSFNDTLDALKEDIKEIEAEIKRNNEWLLLANAEQNQHQEEDGGNGEETYEGPSEGPNELDTLRTKTTKTQQMYISKYNDLLNHRARWEDKKEAQEKTKQLMQNKINELEIENITQYMAKATNPQTKDNVKQLERWVQNVMEAKLAEETSLKDYNSTVKKLQALRVKFKSDIENLLAKYRELRGSSELSNIKEYDAHVQIMEMALNKYSNGDPNLDTPLSQEESSTPVSAEVKATMLEACVLHRLVMRGHNFGVVFEDTGDITTQHGAYVKRLVHYMESKKVGGLMKNLKVDVSGGPVKGDPIGLVRLAALAGLEKTKK